MIKFLKCKENLETCDLEKYLEQSGIKVLKKYKLTGIFKVDIPENKGIQIQTKHDIQSLVEGATIDEVYDDFPVEALLSEAIPQIEADKVWQEFHVQGEGRILGICHTGIDSSHVDFNGRIVATQDFTGEGDYDGHGHGTHVASIAAGSGQFSKGQYKGVAPKASLVIAKGLNSRGQGTAEAIVDSLEWLHDKNVHAINLSLGGQAQKGVRDIILVTCEALVERGIPVFCAAGNGGPNASTISTPGISPKVIAIGAIDDTNHVARFSSRGPTLSGYKKPDVVAPGVNVIAARAKNTSMGTPIDDHYTQASGTSMATPLAAGMGLLILQLNPSLTALDLKALMMESAVKLKNTNANDVGQGRVDAYTAAQAAEDSRPSNHHSLEPVQVDSES